MMDAIKALIYGVVEGITEWLPVSSTGHLILLERSLPLPLSERFGQFFMVAIQLGAVLAALLYFAKFLLSQSRSQNFRLFLLICVSCLPAAFVGILFDDLIDAYFYNHFVVSVMLVLFGIVFLLVDQNDGTGKGMDSISFTDAAVIGVYQLLSAVFPGVSRSGATIIGGLRRGLSRKAAAEYTFLMAIPVMFGAGLLKLFKLKEMPDSNEFMLLAIGAVSAFLISLLVIRVLLRYVKNRSFRIFAYYRILLAVIVMVSLYV